MSEIKQIWCEKDKKFYPEYKTENGKTYKLHPEWFVYLEEFEPTTEQQEQEPIGSYGRKWLEFMKENYPIEIALLEMKGQSNQVALKVEKEASEMYELLTAQWAEAHQPRPTTFTEIAAWEKTKMMECEHTVMEEVVLKNREI